MKLDKTSIIGVFACVILYIVYEQHLNNKYPDRFTSKRQEITSSGATPPQSTTGSKGSYAEPVQLAGPQAILPAINSPIPEHNVETEVAEYKLDPTGGGISSVLLKKYLNEERSQQLDALASTLYIQGSTTGTWEPRPQTNATPTTNGMQWQRQQGPWEISHSLEVDPKSYGFSLVFTWENKDSNATELKSSVLVRQDLGEQKTESQGFLPGMPAGKPSIILDTPKDTERFDIAEQCEARGKDINLFSQPAQNINLFGYDQHYFLTAFIPETNKADFKVSVHKLQKEKECAFIHTLSMDHGLVNPGDKISVKLNGWIGPKDLSELTQFDEALTKPQEPSLKENLIPLTVSITYIS